jgi:hypothetical protein
MNDISVAMPHHFTVHRYMVQVFLAMLCRYVGTLLGLIVSRCHHCISLSPSSVCAVMARKIFSLINQMYIHADMSGLTRSKGVHWQVYPGADAAFKYCRDCTSVTSLAKDGVFVSSNNHPEAHICVNFLCLHRFR